MSFNSELRELMIKYDVDGISFTAGDCSDWHGMYDEQMTIVDNNNNVLLEVVGTYISINDLEED